MDVTAALLSYLSYYLTTGGILYFRFFNLTRDSVVLSRSPGILFALSVGIALLAAFNGGVVWLVGPIFFLALSKVFVKNFDSMVERISANFDSRFAEIEKSLLLEKETLEKVRADFNIKSRRLEKITTDFAAARQTLVCIDTKELSESITRTILDYPGVLSSAVFDAQKNCLSFLSLDNNIAHLENMRGAIDDYFNRTKGKTAAHKTAFVGNFLIYPFVSAHRKSTSEEGDIVGLCVVEIKKNDGVSSGGVEDEISDVKSFLAENVLSVFSLGFSRAVLFKEYDIKSRYDSLTHLFNRRYFMEKLQVEIHRARRYGGGFGVLMLDIDHFKNINDTYGHPAGDDTLVQLSEILLKELSPSYGGIFWGRYGGEEFIGCMPIVSDGEKNAVSGKFFTIISQIAENLKTRIEKKNIVSEATDSKEKINFSITASIGVAVYPDDGDTADKIISAADAALYEAKISGRNRVVFYNKKYSS